MKRRLQRLFPGMSKMMRIICFECAIWTRHTFQLFVHRLYVSLKLCLSSCFVVIQTNSFFCFNAITFEGFFLEEGNKISLTSTGCSSFLVPLQLPPLISPLRLVYFCHYFSCNKIKVKQLSEANRFLKSGTQFCIYSLFEKIKIF